MFHITFHRVKRRITLFTKIIKPVIAVIKSRRLKTLAILNPINPMPI
jgi:hypothetical protein